MGLLLLPANLLLLLFVNVFPRSTSNSEMPTAEGKYLFSFCFLIISPRLGLNKIFTFWEWDYRAYLFLAFLRVFFWWV